MVIKRLRELLLTLAILPMLTQPVLAHAIWVVKGENPREFKVLYGHPERDEVESYDSIKFEQATAYAGNRMPMPLTAKRENEGVTLVAERNVSAITASLNNGYFIQVGEDEYKNVFRPEALAANNEETRITHTYKYAKTLFEPSGIVSQPLGLPIEIIPLKDPFRVGAGQTLQIQVLFQGKPQADVTIEYEGEELKTNADGVASITLKDEEVQIIEAEYRMPSTDDEATDEVAYATSLTIQR